MQHFCNKFVLDFLRRASQFLHSCGVSGRTNSSGRTRGAGGAARESGIEKGAGLGGGP